MGATVSGPGWEGDRASCPALLCGVAAPCSWGAHMGKVMGSEKLIGKGKLLENDQFGKDFPLSL